LLFKLFVIILLAVAEIAGRLILIVGRCQRCPRSL